MLGRGHKIRRKCILDWFWQRSDLGSDEPWIDHKRREELTLVSPIDVMESAS